MPDISPILLDACAIVDGIAFEAVKIGGSAKIWVKDNGDTVVANHGIVSYRDMAVIRLFIKDNIHAIKRTWVDFAGYNE